MMLITGILFSTSIYVSKVLASDIVEYDPVLEAEKLTKERIIPHLLERELHDQLNISNLRLCHCSASNGCTQWTTGYVPNLLGKITKEELNHWGSVCVTDGVCFQHVVSGLKEPSYGCIDAQEIQKEKNDILLRTDTTCKNKTKDPLHENLWICCSGNHYCGNETKVTPQHYVVPTEPSETVSGTTIAIGFSIFAAICFIVMMVFVLYGSKYWEQVQLCHIFKQHNQARNESESNMQEDNISETPSTVLTPLGTRDTTFNCSSNAMTDNVHHRTVAKFLNDLETTCGSGSGQPTILQQLTIAQQIKLEERIGTGRFGSVWRGSWQGENVAVKIFQSTDELAFSKELNIYDNLLVHPNLLRYISSDRIDQGTSTDLWLITEYHENGSLQEYLNKHTVSIVECYRLLESAASGLKFLHLEFQGRKSTEKRGIAHRDLKSRNIMVKNELICVIGDFGLSVIADADSQSIGNKMCGTPRYMAPEVLEGKFGNYYFDTCCCADIYSFSLVMWEVLQRCEDEGITSKPPEESIPYWDKIARDPTPEEMKEVACKTRPAVRTAWLNNPKVNKIVNIMKSAWNPNPSSRPGAMKLWQDLNLGMNSFYTKEESRPPTQFWRATSRTVAATNEESIQMQEMGPNASKKRKQQQQNGEDEQRIRLLEQ